LHYKNIYIVFIEIKSENFIECARISLWNIYSTYRSK